MPEPLPRRDGDRGGHHEVIVAVLGRKDRNNLIVEDEAFEL
jgi:hypothetical protein